MGQDFNARSLFVKAEAEDIEVESNELEENQSIIMNQSHGDLQETKLREVEDGENLLFNVITTRNLGIMNMNVERNS